MGMDTPVVDYPLALVDGTTWGIEDAIVFYGEAEQTTMDGTSELRRFASSSMKYSSKMKFYYYINIPTKTRWVHLRTLILRLKFQILHEERLAANLLRCVSDLFSNKMKQKLHESRK